jgi:hypothetical protein
MQDAPQNGVEYDSVHCLCVRVSFCVAPMTETMSWRPLRCRLCPKAPPYRSRPQHEFDRLWMAEFRMTKNVFTDLTELVRPHMTKSVLNNSNMRATLSGQAHGDGRLSGTLPHTAANDAEKVRVAQQIVLDSACAHVRVVKDALCHIGPHER